MPHEEEQAKHQLKIGFIFMGNLEHKEYAKVVLDSTHIPKFYLIGCNYRLVNDYVENNVSDFTVAINGPKGVGKSLCLLALYHQHKHTTEALLLGVNTIK